ncbi:peptidoglycan-associated lipoprotein Pal [Novosphingobium sp. 9]|uniref:peptidoglycan-associated lipoprotein Pal n=1 Tax=Novosphingobium sp. 9 TaxID=2025349 RepID=UPI0021B512F7|nr:peptidoglycan-associated lipoprotein Pal [Novosphingobium sp. 9]
MSRRTRLIGMSLMVAGALTVSACSKKPPKELPPQPVGPETSMPANTQPAYNGPVKGSSEDFIATMMGADTIYFDTNNYDVDAEDQAALAKQAQWMMQYPNTHATIEGHCDERGTRDYNLALGERRANAAKNYLVSLGVSPDRLTTVSYGKERPIALGSTPDAWAKNRRAVTVVMN